MFLSQYMDKQNRTMEVMDNYKYFLGGHCDAVFKKHVHLVVSSILTRALSDPKCNFGSGLKVLLPEQNVSWPDHSLLALQVRIEEPIRSKPSSQRKVTLLKNVVFSPVLSPFSGGWSGPQSTAWTKKGNEIQANMSKCFLLSIISKLKRYLIFRFLLAMK